MTIAVGTRLGPYEVVSLIGQGGMGEVYRATDTKLHRDVAIKVLPTDVAADPDRLARFEREAQVLASLNHPNIAQIYGVDDSSGTPALVMELLEGPTLADRIAKGPIPLEEALPIARQIAEGLEAAHEQGIIHRDLKPANIKVRPDGTVKVLDFGLAKAFGPATTSAGNATMSPTLSIHATQAGIVLGTAAYMAPEQARGKPVDRRADIWAFGCVLYEMLTGRRAFGGDDMSVTLAAVIMKEPEWTALPGDMPIGVRRLLSRCLKKDPKERLRDVADARSDLGEFLTEPTEPVTVTPIVPAGPLWRRSTAVAGAMVTTAIGTGVIVWFAMQPTVARPRVSRLTIASPNPATLSLNGLSRDVALTPDGTRILYLGANGTTLFVRPLAELAATPLVRGSALQDPFVSPDGEWVGFFDGFTLLKVAITGGPAVRVAQFDTIERGATWAADGTIIVATSSLTTGLQRVSADGGTPTVLTRPDREHGEVDHLWPEVLPGGQAVLYTVTATKGGLDAASIAVLDLPSGRSTILLRGGTNAHYVASGHLVYGAAGMLRAVGFDLGRRRVVGQSTPVEPRVLTNQTGAVEAGVAHDGTLVYVSGSAGERTLVWVDRQGRETPLAAPPRVYLLPRLAPDGTRIAVTITGETVDLWLYELARGTLSRLTDGTSANGTPIWTADGRRVVFASTRAGAPNLFTQAADGTGPVERLTESPNNQVPTGVSPDGRWVVFNEAASRTGLDVLAVRLDGPHQIVPLAQTSVDERNGIVSPDGRWLAYEANDTGAFEIYVRPFPDVNRGHWQVSTSGGTQPLWAGGGQELFYLAPDGTLMRVAVAGGPAWTAGAPTKVAEGRYLVNTVGNLSPRNYDIAPDGQRFLMIKAGGSDTTGTLPQIVVVQHFDEELKRLVPLK